MTTVRSISMRTCGSSPSRVAARAQEELLDFVGTGMSVMEISHRAKEYEVVHEEALSSRELDERSRELQDPPAPGRSPVPCLRHDSP